MRDVRVAAVLGAVVLAIAAKILRASGPVPGGWGAVLGWAPSFCYAFGMPLLLAALPAVARRARRQRWAIFLAASAGVLIAELTQRYEPGRTFAWSDVGALLGGAVLGLALEAWCERGEVAPATRGRARGSGLTGR